MSGSLLKIEKSTISTQHTFQYYIDNIRTYIILKQTTMTA